MQRRDFLKGACRLCLIGATGAAWVDLSGCGPAVSKAISSPDIEQGMVKVPVDLFESGAIQIISPKQYPYEIAIEKKRDGTYKALLLKCTHQSNQLMPTGSGYTCDAHGSRFGKEGEVIKGPAESPLLQLKTTLTGPYILVHL